MTKEIHCRAAGLVAALLRAAHAPADDALLLALAFLVKNRLASPRAQALEARLPVTADTPASRPLLAAAKAALSRTYSGAETDPTRGATELHRHEEAPDWAERLEARALIGPYLFLAAPDMPACAPALTPRRESIRTDIHP